METPVLLRAYPVKIHPCGYLVLFLFCWGFAQKTNKNQHTVPCLICVLEHRVSSD